MTKNTASIQATYVHWLTNICSSAHEHMFMDKRTYVLRMMMVVLMMMIGANVWGQPAKVSDGIYYIQNTATNKGYLWPSLTTNTTTGYRYLTTSLDISADAVNNVSGVSYPAHDKSYSHWVVKNVTGGYIQLINPRLNKYVVIRQFPKANNSNGKENTYGDRDVWLTDEPAAEDIDYTYFVLNNDKSPYKISPKAGLNGVNDTSGYTLNSAAGDDRKWLTWSTSGNPGTPKSGEGRDGLIQIYSGGTPTWTFTSDLLDAPTISDVNVNDIVTVIDVNGLPEGYNIRYTTDGSDPDASSPILEGNSYTVTSSQTLKAVVERYGIVLTAVAEKAIAPAPCATPVITFDYTTSNVSISCATPNSAIYCTTNGTAPTTSSSVYNGPFSVTSPTTVKAIATHADKDPSSVAELVINQVAAPVTDTTSDGKVKLTSTTPSVTIYYEIGDDESSVATPTMSSTRYTGPLQNVSGKVIKAIAVKDGWITSDVGGSNGPITLQCVMPVIRRATGNTFTISSSFPAEGVIIYYTTGSGDPTTLYEGPVSISSYPVTVKAIATADGYSNSSLAEVTIIEDLVQDGDYYLISSAGDFEKFVSKASTADGAGYKYKVTDDFTYSSTFEITQAFTGTFDGGFYTITGLKNPLFKSLNDGIVKNVILDNVSISSGTNVGAICNEATGASRIYNCGILATSSTAETDDDGYTKITSCSSTISGSGYVGGIVGLLDGSSRVINSFSYANVSGGTHVGGIVGYNNVATTASNLQTMVMNCMFYGEVSGGSIAPIYNGEIITNDGDADGVNNFNYFRLESSYIQNTDIAKVYNCALGAETRFLQRFEFFRHLLNSNRELAAWWASTSTTTVTKDEMMKWVMEPSQIGTSTPYPILKAPDRYPSVVNIDVNHSDTYKGRDMTVGPKLSKTLSVTIRNSTTDAVYGAPTGANITNTSLSLNIMDKDPDHFNFNYYKVQLPYYNDVGTGNYTGNRVVTGWKIVTISGGTTVYSTDNDNNATTPADAEATISSTGDITLDKTPYNFADRNCTDKDKYGVSGRVFNQGAYWDVPEGVTAITIEPYWGKAVYLSDAYWDVTYKNNGNDAMATAANVPNVGGGQRYENGKKYNLATQSIDETNGQIVYTSMSNAIASSGTALFADYTDEERNSHSVYDYAVVLVGNYHFNGTLEASNSKPYTVTSIDLDGDNEPDYSYILRFNSRIRVHPVRIDFLTAIGLGMAQKTTGGTGTYNFGIMQPKGWFESTNTATFRMTQFEYDYAGRVESPMILQGGVIEQWVTVGGSEQTIKEGKTVTYYHVGGNVWFKEFHIGVHQDKTQEEFVSPHPPISVTGGDFDEFYLTGLYNTPNNTYPDNAECYINGGRFGKVAGTGMQGIGNAGGAGVTGGSAETGNIIWQIDNADIDEFYAGGINAAHIAEGNIYTVITNSRVDQFCGGPKFGNMNSDKKVVTNATNCTFRTFFGAGYGGNSYNRRYPQNQNNVTNINWNTWVQGDDGLKYRYDSDYGGVETRIDYQFIPMSNNTGNVARLFVDYVSFSLATTHDVTSKLTGCTITTSPLGRLSISDDYKCLGSFYGGGSLGMVTGDVKSTLTNCTVEGNVFGGGYSATLPTVKVMNNSFQTSPRYDQNLGAYLEAKLPATVDYTWEHATETEFNNKQVDTGKKILYTTEELTGLGAVTGNVTLTIDGNTTLTDGKKMSVTKSVYGGGEESNVEGNTQVNINGGTITQNVFGGGKGEADEFSCSKAMIGVNNTGAGANLTTDENKNKGTKVTISNGQVNGNVYGGGEVGRVEWNTQVKIGVGTGNGPFAPVINGSVFGAGKGEKTHGYAALVRGNSTVTIQGNAKVRENVYGGGEQATVGRYWVKGINNVDSEGHPISGAPPAPTDMPDEMPYKTMSGGQCTVTIQGSAQIGPESGAASETTGHVFGAGKGVTPNYVHTGATTNWSKRMVDYNSEKHISGEGGNEGQTWDYYVDDKGKKDTRYVWEYFVDDADPTAADYKTGEAKYLEFLQTLALVTGTDVTINGATVKGNVYGGSESGFVQDDTDVKIQAGTIGTSGTTTYGNVFGGGKGLAAFAEAGKVKGNTEVAISGGTAHGNVYGGGELGDVGTINKANIDNYTWSGYDDEDPTNDTGKCKVSITNAAATVKGDVFGAGQGSGVTFQCEKAMAYNTEVTISAGTVNGNIYGGGKIGRVENNTKVKIGDGSGSATGTAAPVIAKSVFGAGQGLKTHGYSALVRGNTEVTVEGNAKVGKNVYGGGEIASVGRYGLNPQKMPNILLEGGDCKVTIQGYAVVGPEDAADDEGNVFGAGRGVDTPYDNTNKPQRMTLDGNGNTIPETIDSEEAYQTFLETLALATKPEVTIGGNATVNGSVFGGGELGLTKGSVIVTINGGTIERDVYGGGALAHTNTTDKKGVKENGVWKKENGEYVTTDVHPTTYVKLLGGIIGGEAYGGGLGDANTPAYVYGDVLVDLNGTTTMNTTTGKPTTDGASIAGDAKGCVVNQIFGCNNINGTPKGDVMVHVFATQNAAKGAINGTVAKESEESDTDYLQRLINVSKNGGTTVAEGVDATVIASAQVAHDSGTSAEITAAITAVTAELGKMYDVQAVYGGGNNAAYIPTTAYTESTPTGSKAQVVIEGCDYTSIQYVYGGGNAAPVPDTYVLVKGTKIIDYVFGGGNGTVRAADVGYDGNGNNQGDGNANTTLMAGTIHNVYGASNTNGDIRGKANITKLNKSNTDTGCCDKLVVNKMYSAGKDADISGGSKVILGCMEDDWIEEYYGGAENANVLGDVELTITSGKFRKVFGGNKTSGAIFGHIKVNIEETGCIPIYIDELYGCGNEAPYSIYGYSWDGTSTNPNNGKKIFTARTSASNGTPVKPDGSAYTNEGDDTFTAYDSPEVNIISATHIGKVFGGGLGSNAIVYGNPTVNINMIYGTPGGVTATALGEIGDVYGGGNAAAVIGNPTVNIGMATTVQCHESFDKTTIDETHDGYTYSDAQDVLGAYITGNVFGGGNLAEVSGNTYVNICGTQNPDSNSDNGYSDTAVSHSGTTDFAVSIGNSVYGGGNAADVLGNTFVTMADGYVFNGIFGGGYSGSVGTFTTSTASTDVNIWGHTAHNGTCIGKPTACENGTGTCYVVVSGGQIGPVEVATQGMNRTAANGGPVPQGWVWGAGCGLVEDPSDDPDTHFKTYVNNTDVTIKGDAFILESIIGGGEFGRVLGNTLVKIEGGQIGVGANKVDENNKPIRYTADQWTEAEEAVRAGNASRINTIAAQMPECSHFPYGKNIGTEQNPNWVYDTYDPFADEYKTAKNSDLYPGGSTDNASDGKTWIGCVFAGGSGYMPYKKVDANKEITGYDWVRSAGWVEGDAEVRISGGHILSNVYGGNEYTDVKGTCTVKMSGGTVGVPRTLEQIMGNPLIGYIYGAGKGDPRVHFNKVTNVKDVEIEITGGTVFGSVYGGGEDGHVLRDVTITIGKDDHTGPEIGTWGTSYVDGNVFGGGRGFSGEAYTAGNVAGSVKMDIKGGSILGSVYGGGRMASVGYGLFDATTGGSPTPGYGEMRDDNDVEEGFTDGTTGFFTHGRGHIDITISGGTIGNKWEYEFNPNDTYKTTYVPNTEYDSDNRLKHTKGGNVFAGGMGNLYEQNGTTYINMVDWWKLGCVKSTKLTISGNAVIKSTVFGGGELGQVVGAHTAKNAANADVSVGTEIIINGGTIGSEVKDGSNVVQYTFGSVFGGGYGSLLDDLTVNGETTHPKFDAGLVKEDTKIDMQDGTVKASIYGGGEMASVGESTTSGETTTVTGSTYVTVSGGTVGIQPITVSDTKRYFGGAKMGNVYGGGSGYNNTVRSGRILKNTNVTINGGTIYHNVYGGGAYGTVGDFDYQTGSDTQGGPVKVQGVNGLATEGTGVATVTIKGGTIGYDGNENGMVFGSSRGDINEPGARDDHCAWVYDTNVIIGTEGSETGPQIKGAVYGSGENGHTYNNTVVTVYSGTIGIAEGSPIGTYTEGGAAYPYRGNVYGGGCGTDTYPVTVTEGQGQSAVTKTIQAFNPLAGIVYGNTTVNINGGKVVRNVYGAGAMGSVGKTTWTTTETTTGSVTTTTKSATTSGGSTTININGGIIGVSGTVGDGNVFGAARGSKAVVQADRDDLSRVSVTNVNVSGGLVKGNVYGGGELGDVGTIVKNTTDYNYTWEKSDGGSNVAENNKITGTNTNTGICNVTITGGTIGSTTAGTGNVFGGGKGDANTWWCEKAMAFAANVSISKGSNATAAPLVYGTVYGGGEVGRVEDDTKVIIGTANGSDEPDIKGNVFGAGKGMATRGYSALVRGNSIVTIQGSAKVGGNVFGGGEEASLGRFNLVDGLPKSPASGGSSEVTIQDNAKIGSSGTGNHVYGAGQGVNPNYVTDTTNPNKYKDYKSMQLYDNRPKDDKDVQGTYWDYYVDDDGHTDENFVWVYYKTEPEYQAFLNTLALASHPKVTIAENATIYGDVYGGGQRGITMGDVEVNITGGTVKRDVYGGGSLADTNKGNWDDSQYVETELSEGHTLTNLYTRSGAGTTDSPYVYTLASGAAVDGTTYYSKGTWATGKYDGTATMYKTNVALTGGTIEGNVYGGGLGQIARAASEGSAAQGTEGEPGYVPAVPAVTKLDEVKAKVFGNVLVKLNEKNGENGKEDTDDCKVHGSIFGCNNQNGSPQSAVTVHVYKTEGWEGHMRTGKELNGNALATALNDPDDTHHSYELNGVYGGGNLSAFYPDLKATRDTVQAFVIIDGCDQTSIKQVYGGGNAASIPATNITINASYEIEEVFGGGNGLNEIIIHDQTMTNPGANVGYEAYPTSYDIPASSKEERTAKFCYGSGKSSVTIYDGLIHRVFGGSNKKGNVRESAVTLLDDQSGCHFQVDEAYGGGKNAPMDAEAKLLMACIPGLKVAYGGAQEADVLGGVTLTITNGTYERVFGGNNISGTIQGPIVVNIEETGCRPVIIGELYGGGNQAAYSVYGYKLVDGELKPRESASDGDAIAGTPYADPVVNVKSFTSIGTIYGGGYGETAVMVGNPTVNIDVFKGQYADDEDNVINKNAKVVGSTVKYSGDGYDTGFPVPSHAKGAIGAIGTVFGGGYGAKVIGTPTVNIGTRVGEQIDLLSVPVEDSNGKTSSEAGWIPTYQKETVLGADIRGDIYGAGNNAEVTGDTKVQIGKKIETSTTPDPDPTPAP